MGPACSSTVPAQLPGEQYDVTVPAVITMLETIQTHKQSLHVQPGTRSFLGPRVHIQVKCLPQGYRTTPCQPRQTQELLIQSRGPQPRHPACIMKYIFIYMDNEGGHCQELIVLSGSFTSHTTAMRWHHHLHGHVSQDRSYTQPPKLEGGKADIL